MSDSETIAEHLDRGELAPAEAALDEALSKTPGDEELLALRGSLRHLQRRFQAAVEDFEAALAKRPNEPNWHNALGKSLNNLQKEEPAENAFRRSIELEPGNAEAWHNLAFALRTQGKHHQAAEAFSKALEIEPGYVSAWHNLGVVYLAMDDPEQALGAFVEAQKLAPDRPRLGTHIGVALHNLGRYEDAIAAYRAISSIEQDAEAQNNLAVSLQELGRDDEALTAYKKAAQLESSDEEIQIKIADLLIGMGKPGEANDIARQCLARVPGKSGALAVAVVAGQEPGCEIIDPGLLDFDRLIFATELAISSEQGSLAEFNQALVTHILEHPTLVYEPAGHATRFGSHTGDLLAGGKGPIATVEREITAGIGRYLATLDQDKAGFLFAGKPDHWRLTMWAVVMDAQGHQLPHIHPAAWLSGVYYVQVPEEIGDDDGGMAGWIEFGAPPDTMNCRGEPKLKIFHPVAGNYFIFPSYLYHRTIPFASKQQRISIAFDAIPSAMTRD
ncbi:MAG: tetratricopeptide repeat protein [Gammaproteobacteria bacterium]|nr:tetratricopeptide repeat protein [Gammaproteobacteria bacterium]